MEMHWHVNAFQSVEDILQCSFSFFMIIGEMGNFRQTKESRYTFYTMNTPLVGIVMGSQSDSDIMQKVADTLTAFGVKYEMKVLSAHRMPEMAAEFSKSAFSRGIKVIIAGAGMAAHLAGAMAANTTLPVIGVPLSSRLSIGNGLDSLLATVQMPSGVPVATVAIDGAKNAAILAVQILALSDAKLAKQLETMKREMMKR